MAEPNERFRDVLEVFVYRARRTEAHSLAADKESLLGLARKTINFEVEDGAEGQKAWVVFELPPEETMESLASRCRPFVLPGDTVHYSAVLNALGYFVRQDQELIDALDGERKRWSKLRRDHPEPLGYLSSVGPVGEAQGPKIADRELAYRWLYGDLVHADDLRDLDHDLTSRYEAGVLLTALIAVRAISLLNIVKAARGRSLVTMSELPFRQEIRAQTSRRLEARMVIAPVGTPINAMEEVLDNAGRPAGPGEGAPDG